MRTLILLIALAAATPAQSEDGSLTAARELYTVADYRSALEMLNRLNAGEASPQDRRSIDLYRTFCLIALGRTEEADEAIAAMITRDPLYRPADSEIPPRLRPLFTDKRKLVLPSIIQSQYERAKSAFDRSEYKTAAEAFTNVLIALADPDIKSPASRPPLSDLRVLATGFNDLAVRAMTPPPAPQPEPPAAAPKAAAVSAPRIPKIYDSNDADVIAPVTVNQDIPRFPRPVLTERTGVLFIVIDETGGVESAIITATLERAYDQMVLAAAKTWRYQPATRSGVAVKYRKRIQLTLPRQTN